MDPTTPLADLLTKYMKDRDVGPTRLAERVTRLGGNGSLVSRRSIENWRDGVAKSARDWRQIVVIAAALELDEAQTDALLRSAGLPGIAALRRQASKDEVRYFASWSTERTARGLSSPLRWEDLRQAAATVTESEMGALKDRFRSDLYVQRQDLLQDLLRFASSNKTAFALIGNSGVGKTSFLLSLVERSQAAEELCFCVYDGARLSAEVDLSEKVGADLAGCLGSNEVAGEDFLARIAEMELMHGRALVVAFDAINENPSGRALLHKIDQWVGEITTPWLKVVVTSRPEAWRTMKRGLPLADHRYYHGAENTALGVKPVVVLEPFEQHELQEAYDKYRASFGFDATFDQLSSSWRSALRDPLILSFVGELFNERLIPLDIGASNIYRLFIRGLLQTERLYEEDVQFLENELMPLMIDGHAFRNRVSAQQIRDATSLTGTPLLTTIRAIGSSTAIATPYTRLVDSGILLEQGPPDAYEISFRHERLYDYYTGRRLRALLDRAQPDRTAALLGFIAALPTHAFLWGPLQRVLISEFQRGDLTAVVQLAQAPDDIVKQLLVETMVEYGKDNPDSVRRVLEELLHLSQQRASGLHSRDFDAPPILRAKQIAIEVAANLAIPDILVAATCDPSAFVRNHALLFLQVMSEHTPEGAVQVVQSLGAQASMKFGIPRPRALESLIGASALMSAGFVGNTALLGDVQATWQRVIDRYLGMGEGNRGLRSRLNTSLRQMLLLFATRSMASVLHTLVPASSSVNFSELEQFVQQSAEDRSRFSRLLPFLDPQHGPWTDAYADLAALCNCRDFVTTELLAMLILSGWGKLRLHEMIDFAESLLAESLSLDKPGPMVAGVMGAVSFWFSGDPTTDLVVLETLNRMFWEYYHKSYGISWSNVAPYEHSYLDRLIMANYEITGSIYPRGVQDHLLRGAEAGDYHLHRLLLGETQRSTMPLGILDFVVAQGHRDLALAIAGYLARFREDALHHPLYEFLARTRLRYRRSVDDFVDFYGLDMGILRASEASISAKEIADVAILVTSPIIYRMPSYPVLYREVCIMLNQLPDCQTVAQIVQCFVKRVACLAYGSPILDRVVDLPII